MPLSAFGKEYLLLGLRMGKVIGEYIDSYFGPCELKHLVNSEEPFSLRKLLSICQYLQRQLPDQGFNPLRVIFFEKMFESMETLLKIKMGELIPYVEQVERLYDITLDYLPDSEMYTGAEQLDSFYEGSGSLLDRINNVYTRRELPKDFIMGHINHAMKLLRERTYELFPNLLSKGEHVKIVEVSDKKWMGYLYYKGNYQSQFDMCTDGRVGWHGILEVSSHEGYPGHHVLSCVQDKNLYQEKGYFEQSIRLVFSPQMVLYEGIANLSLELLFTPYEIEKIAYENYCSNPEEEDFDNLLIESQIWKSIRGRYANYAYHLYVDEWSEQKLFNHLLHLGIYPETFIPSIFKELKKPNWETFHYTYYVGEKLIKKKYGEKISPQNYEDLLTNPYIPSNFL
jgi:hypothetical protein